MVTKVKKVLGLLAFICGGEGFVLMGTIDFGRGYREAIYTVFGFGLAGLFLALFARPLRRAKVALMLAIYVILASIISPILFPVF